jgi:hypothetical protein
MSLRRATALSTAVAVLSADRCQAWEVNDRASTKADAGGAVGAALRRQRCHPVTLGPRLGTAGVHAALAVMPFLTGVLAWWSVTAVVRRLAGADHAGGGSLHRTLPVPSGGPAARGLDAGRDRYRRVGFCTIWWSVPAATTREGDRLPGLLARADADLYARKQRRRVEGTRQPAASARPVQPAG